MGQKTVFSGIKVLATCLLLVACSSQPEYTPATSGAGTADAGAAPVATDSLLKGTLVSRSGDSLQYQFANEARTMTITFKGVSSMLHQDTTASGIKYSNDQFVYTEWHGNATLKEKGNTVFAVEEEKK